MTWIICQLGAREHYAVARALAGRGALARLVTDAWIRPGNVLGRFRETLRGRFHPDLENAQVNSANTALLAFEFLARLRRLKGWDLTMARNRWFQRHAMRSLEKLKGGMLNAERLTVFAYSYAARDIFKWAKAQGWRTVLGQIDAGPAMDRIVREQVARRPEWQAAGARPPESYWEAWREECDLADKIVVNSAWVREALVDERVPPAKVEVVPLAFEPVGPAPLGRSPIPEGFNVTRPLRVLMVGQMSLLKGVADVLAAAQLLTDRPIEFTLVGPCCITPPMEYCNQANVRWIGSVARSRTREFYDAADLLLFPSYGDGFGLVQLEALARGLPVISSKCCGDVIADGFNGRRLSTVSPESIADTLREVLAAPTQLRTWSLNSRLSTEYSLATISQKLLSK